MHAAYPWSVWRYDLTMLDSSCDSEGMIHVDP